MYCPECSDMESIVSDRTDLISNFSGISGFEEEVSQIKDILINVKKTTSVREKNMHLYDYENKQSKADTQYTNGCNLESIDRSASISMDGDCQNVKKLSISNYQSAATGDYCNNPVKISNNCQPLASDEVHVIMKEKAHLQGQMSALQKEHSDLKNKHQEEMEEISRLRSQLDMQVSKINELNNGKYSLTSEIAGFKQTISCLNMKLLICNQELTSRQNELSLLKRDSGSLESANETLRVALEQTKVDLSIRDNSIKALKTKVCEYHSDLQSLLQDKLQIESQFRILKSQNDLLQKHNIQQKEKIVDVQHARNKSQQELLSLQSNYLMLQNTKGKLESENAGLMQEITSLRKNSVREKENLSFLLQDIQADITARETINQKFKEDRGEVERALMDRLDVLERERQKYQQILLSEKNYEEEIKSLEATVHEKSTTIMKIEESMTCLQQETNELKKQLQTRMNDQQITEESNTQLKKLVDNLKTETISYVSIIEKCKVLVGTILYAANKKDESSCNLEENLNLVLQLFQTFNNDLLLKEKQIQKMKDSKKQLDVERTSLIDKIEKLESFKAQHGDCSSQKVELELHKIEIRQLQLCEQEHISKITEVCLQLQGIISLFKQQKDAEDRPTREVPSFEDIQLLMGEIKGLIQKYLDTEVKGSCKVEYATQTMGEQISQFETHQTSVAPLSHTVVHSSSSGFREEMAVQCQIDVKSPDLEDEREMYRKKIQILESQVKLKEEEVASLNNLLESSKQTIEVLQSNMRTEKDFSNILQDDPSRPISKDSALHCEMDLHHEPLDDERELLIKKIEMLELRVKSYVEEVTNLNKSLDSTLQEKAVLKSEFRKKQEGYKYLQDENKSLILKLGSVKAENEELKKKVEANKIVPGANKYCDKDIEEMQKKCKEHVRRYESNIKLLTRKLKEHMKARKDTENHLAELLKELHRKDEETKIKCDGSDRTLNSISLQLETERGFVRGLQSTISSLKSTNADLHAKLTAMESAKSLSEQHAQELLINKENLIINLNDNMANLESQLEESLKSQKELNNQVQSERQDSSNYKAQVYSLGIGLDTANQQIATLNTRLESLNEELVSSQGKQQALNESQQELALKYEEAVLNSKALEDEIQVMREKEPLLENQLQSLNLHLHKKNQEIKSLDEQLSFKINQHKQEEKYLKKNIDELNTEVRQAKADLRCALDEKSKIQIRALELQAILSNMMERYKIMQSRYQIISTTSHALDIDCLPSPTPIDDEKIQSLLEKSLIEPHCKPLAQLQSCLDVLKEEMSVLHNQLGTQDQPADNL